MIDILVGLSFTVKELVMHVDRLAMYVDRSSIYFHFLDFSFGFFNMPFKVIIFIKYININV